MGGHKQKKKTNFNRAKQEPYVLSNYSAPARNMRKADLGSVIFGCKNSTINECLSKLLFGLPEGHLSYIKNISKGLALFLFNYSDRTLHGIFEAAGPGQMNIDKYAWLADGDDTGYTHFPAQVRICVRQECQALSEKQFRPIIANNYYESKHFYFELDHHQTNQLISLFQVNPVNEVKYPQIPRLKSPYFSVLGECSTSPTRQWSSLFKTESTIDEQSASDAHEEEKAENQANTWDEEARIWNGLGDTCDGAIDAWNVQSDNWGEQQPIFVGDCTTSATRQWSSLFKTQSTIDEQSGIQDSNPSFSASDLYEEKAEIPQANTCDGEVDRRNANPWGEQQANTSEEEEQQPIVTADEVTGVQTWEQYEERPSSESYETEEGVTEDTVEEQDASNDLQSLVVKLMQEVKELKGSQTKQIVKVNVLQQELVQSKQEIDQLRTHLSNLVSIVDPVDVDSELLKSKLVDPVYIVGGFDGCAWLSSLESYFPCQDHRCSHSPMKYVKTYASAATLNGEIFHFGGEGLHTVESFNPTMNQWVSRPPLHWKNIYAAGASINDRLFVVGGAANGSGGPSEVEYLDLNIGMWLPAHAMQTKRLGPAVAELNNALYVSGGYDGASYLSSVERFDPREEAWYHLPSMNKKKGCHSMLVLHKKLYSVGGFDGDNYIKAVECFDTRMGSWVEAEPMNVSRGSFGAFVMGEKLYAIGGATENNQLLDIVECYNEGSRWETVECEAVGKRSNFAAIVM